MCFGTNEAFAPAVQWYWCEPSAKDLGIPTPFASRNYLEAGTWPATGEVEGASRPWRNGSFAITVLGQGGPCGCREVIEEGCPVPIPPGLPRDDYGLAWCCFSQAALSGQPLFLFYPYSNFWPIQTSLWIPKVGGRQGWTYVPSGRSRVLAEFPIAVHPPVSGPPPVAIVRPGRTLRVWPAMPVQGSKALPAIEVSPFVGKPPGRRLPASAGIQLRIMPVFASSPPAPGVSFDADFGGVGSSVIAGWSPSSTPGNVLIVGIYVIGGTAITPTGWTLASMVTNGASNGYIYSKISAGETSVTITLSGPVQWTVFSGEFLPGSLAGTVDQAASNYGKSSMANTGTTSPTTSPIELAIGLIGDGIAPSPTIGGGFVVPLGWQFTEFGYATMGYRILTSVGPQEMTAAFPGTIIWAGCIATIR